MPVSASKEPLVPFDPKRTALVLIEYQNDFASDGGALHDAVEDVMASTGCWRTRGAW
jgi:nicotinamidase-related amidase